MFTITLTRQQLYELYYEGPEPTIHLIESLLEELADQERILGGRQQRIIDSRHERNERQAARLKSLKGELERQQCLNSQLTRRIRELQAEPERRDERAGEPRRDSHNTPLPPALDLPGVKAQNAARRTRSLRRRTGGQVGGQPGHRGSTLPRVERPDRVITYRPRHCRRCAAPPGGVAVTAVERRQFEDVPPVRVEVTEHRAETRRCAACGERTRAGSPRGVRSPVQYGERVRARATYLHRYQLLPLARTAEAMRELSGRHVSPATLHTTKARCSAKLAGAEERIKAALRHSEVIGADETGLRVAGRSGRTHVARTDRLTHYGYDARRGRAATDAFGIPPGFKGTCVRDGWYAYDGYGQCRQGLCGAHLLRELVYVEEVSPDRRQWTQPFIKLLLGIKAAAGRAREAGLGRLGGEVEAKFTRRYDRLVRRAGRLSPPPPKEKPDPALPKCKVVRAKRRSPARPLLIRLRERRDEVLRFMTDLSVPFDNNGSERGLRMVKLQQKIGGCFRTSEGAAALCRIRGYLSTARKQGHSVLSAPERAFRGRPFVFKDSPGPE